MEGKISDANRKIGSNLKLRHLTHVNSKHFQAEFKESKVRLQQNHLHGAGGQVQEGHGGGHHVLMLDFSQIFQAEYKESHLHDAGDKVQEGHCGGCHILYIIFHIANV